MYFIALYAAKRWCRLAAASLLFGLTSVCAQTAAADLQVTAYGPDNVHLQWTGPTSGYDRVELQKSIDGSPYTASSTWLSGVPTSAIDYDVGPGRSYDYRVATFSGGNVAYSNVASAATPAVVLSVTGVTGRMITLDLKTSGTWHRPIIQGSTDGVNFTLWNFTFYGGPISPLNPGTTYYIRIATGVDPAHPTGFSNTVSATTNPAESFPPEVMDTTSSWHKDTRILEVFLHFTRPVVVTGTPTVTAGLYAPNLSFEIPYAEGSGTDTLVFRLALPTQFGRLYVFSPINLHGGGIRGTDDVAASLQVPELLGITFIESPIVPTIGNATVIGRVGTPIAPVTISSTGVAGMSASGLAGYGLRLDGATGVVSGTPTKVADNVVVEVIGSGQGMFVEGNITLNITAGETAPPPPDNPPPTPGKADQTITFSSPVSAVVVGQPIQLGATSSAGLPITYTVVGGDATLSGSTLTPTSTATLIVRASSAGDATTNAASVDVNFGNPQKAAQAITVSTPTGSVAAEKPVALAATTTSGLPVSYSVVSGPATITGSTLVFTGTGTVTVKATQAGNGGYAPANDVTLTFNAVPVNRLINLSSRVHVSAGDATHGAIAGFVVTGAAPKRILIRAVGPSLSSFGVTAPLAAPQLQVFDQAGGARGTNSGWANDAQIAAAGDAVGAFRLAGGSKDAALLLTLEPGAYTAQVQSTGSGTALVEVYDVAANAAVPTKQLINLSTRGQVGSGDDVVVAGFVVAGQSPKRVLIRAIGPGLASFGVSGVVENPMLKLYDAHGVVLARNDDWETAQTGDVIAVTTSAADVTAADMAAGAFALAAGSKDAALVLTLDPGTYTAIASGAGNGTGAALVEVYELPEK